MGGSFPEALGPRDLIGRRVRLRRNIETVGGTMFAEGAILTVQSTWRGRFCLGFSEPNTPGVRHVSRHDFEVLPLEEDA